MAIYDRVIKDGMIIDGTRAPRYRADIGIKDGRIARIGHIDAALADEVDIGEIAHPGRKHGHDGRDDSGPGAYCGTDSGTRARQNRIPASGMTRLPAARPVFDRGPVPFDSIVRRDGACPLCHCSEKALQ